VSTRKTLAAVDLGAGSGRVVLGSWNGEVLHLKEVHRFPNPVEAVGGLLRWDLDFLEHSVREGMKKIAPEEKVSSLGIDTWGVDFVLIDKNGRPLERARCYRNEHTRDWVVPTLEALGVVGLYRRTGIQTQHFNTLFQLAAWKKSSPAGFDQARRFAMVPDWLAHRLGAPIVNEATNASTTQLLDARTRDWDRRSLEILGIASEIFGVPVYPGTVLTPSVTLGAHRPAIVAPATHDTGSAVAAIPLVNDKSAFVATGTWCLIGIESSVPETGDQARAANFTNEAGVDGTYRFLKNCMGLWLVQQLKASWPACPDFGVLAADAARAVPFVALVDADDPRFFQPASMKEALESWWRESGQPFPDGPGGYARCCVESLVLAFMKTLGEIETIRKIKLERIHLVGGGSQDTLLCQLTADATGIPVLAGPVEASALGNLVVQARALGWISSQKEARALVARSFPLTEYRPRGNQAEWRRVQEKMEAMKEETIHKGDHV